MAKMKKTRRPMTAGRLYAALITVADDHEAAMIERIAEQAGFVWICECKYVNWYDERRCCECGSRPVAR